MTAWLAANCVADDILEDLPLADAIRALEETIMKLQGKKSHGMSITIGCMSARH